MRPLLLLALATAACVVERKSDDPEPPVSGARSASAPESVSVPAKAAGDAAPVAMVPASGNVWLEAVRGISIRGASSADTLVLRATGTRSDSLTIGLLAVISGDTIAIAEWNSDYELIDPPPEVLESPAKRDEYLREALLRTLSGAVAAPFTEGMLSGSVDFSHAPDRVDCEEDVTPCVAIALQRTIADTVAVRAELAALANERPRTLTVSYGYETTEILLWYARGKRFLLAFACC